MNKIYKVYLIKDKHRNPVYCGLTGKTLESRFKEHKYLKKLDDTYVIELVQDNLTREDAAKLEMMLIQQYGLLNIGLNKSPGSINGYSQFHSEKQKLKWSKERKGKPVSPSHAAKNRVARLGKKNSPEHQAKIIKPKPVVCLETGKIYPSGRQAAKELGLSYSKVSNVCLGKRKHTKGYTFKFYEIVETDRNDQSLSKKKE